MQGRLRHSLLGLFSLVLLIAPGPFAGCKKPQQKTPSWLQQPGSAEVVLEQARVDSIKMKHPVPDVEKFTTLLSVRESYWQRQLIVIDEEGRAWLPGYRAGEYLALPFTEPVEQISLRYGEKTDSMYCAKTRSQGLQCVSGKSASIKGRLHHDELERLYLIDFPSLDGKVAQLARLTYDPCVMFEDGAVKCLSISAEHVMGEPTYHAGIYTPSYEIPFPEEAIARSDRLSSSGLFIREDVPREAARCRLDEGAVSCRGSNLFGELGDGSDVLYRQEAQPVVGIPTEVVSLVAGERSFCALDVEGVVWCWGEISGLVDVSPRPVYPPCKVDRAASEAQREQMYAQEVASVEACMQRVCGEGALDCHLGCVVTEPPYTFVIDQGAHEVCVQPMPPMDLSMSHELERWLTDEELARGHEDFLSRQALYGSSKPAKLRSPFFPLRALTFHGDQLCGLTREGVLACR